MSQELSEEEYRRLYEAAMEVDDSEMYEVDDPPTEAELAFAVELQELIEELYVGEELNEDFKDRSKLYDHFRRHCYAKDPTKKSKRASVYYDFKDISLYMERERYLQEVIKSSKSLLFTSLLVTDDIIKGFRKLFEGGGTSLVFSRDCGFISTDGKPVSILMHAYANNVTKNYRQNTVDFMMYSKYTKTLFPIDANYLENKFNNLVTKWNTKYNLPFKINHWFSWHIIMIML